jgi:hypothetical protein
MKTIDAALDNIGCAGFIAAAEGVAAAVVALLMPLAGPVGPVVAVIVDLL